MNKQLITMLIALSCLMSSVAMAGNRGPQYSTIKADGHLVPVGDHHLYRYDYLPWNVSVSPFFVIGHYGIGVERALTDYVAARVSGSYHDLIESDEPAEMQVSLGAPIYFRKMQDGFFFEPSVGFKHIRGTEAMTYDDGFSSWTEEAREAQTTAYLGSQIGWRMIWDSGLNVTASAGMARRLQPGSGDEVMGLSRLDIGFSF